MTKEKLRRLIDLTFYAGSGRYAGEEYDALRAEFEAWEPDAGPPPLSDADREAGRQRAMEMLKEHE